MILGVQLLGFFFGALMLYMTFVKTKRREFTTNESIFWTLLWIVFIILVLFPRIVEPITTTLNFARKFDLYVIIGIIFVVFATYYTYMIARSTQKKVDELISLMAIHKAKQSRKKK
jgi:hypothetical protein